MKRVLSSMDTKLASGRPYWPIHNGTLAPGQELRQDISAEVAVIGGGITGALVAHELTATGFETVLLEKGRIGMGSTCASTALLSYEYDEHFTHLIKSLGESDAVRVHELCREAICKIEKLVKATGTSCDFDPKQSLRLARDESDCKDLELEAKLFNRHGFDHEVLDRENLRRRFDIDSPLGIASKQAAQIDPFKLAHALIGKSEKAGLRTFERTKVTAYEDFDHCVELQTSKGVKIHAGRVIFATGYESEKYLEHKIGRLNTDFCFISHPIRSIEKLGKCHFVEQADNYLYVSTFGKRVMVGMEDSAFRSPKQRATLFRKRTQELLDRFQRYAPGIALTPEFRWAGTFAKSKDSLPYLVEIDQFPHAFFVLGYGGNGIAASSMLATILADLMANGKSKDAGLFRFDR